MINAVTNCVTFVDRPRRILDNLAAMSQGAGDASTNSFNGSLLLFLPQTVKL